MTPATSSPSTNRRSRAAAHFAGAARARREVVPKLIVGVVFWVCTALPAGLVLMPFVGWLAAAYVVAVLTPVVVFITVALFPTTHGFDG